MSPGGCPSEVWGGFGVPQLSFGVSPPSVTSCARPGASSPPSCTRSSSTMSPPSPTPTAGEEAPGGGRGEIWGSLGGAGGHLGGEGGTWGSYGVSLGAPEGGWEGPEDPGEHLGVREGTWGGPRILGGLGSIWGQLGWPVRIQGGSWGGNWGGTWGRNLGLWRAPGGVRACPGDPTWVGGEGPGGLGCPGGSVGDLVGSQWSHWGFGGSPRGLRGPTGSTGDFGCPGGPP